MGLILDYARITGNVEFARLVESRARDYYMKDRNCPLSYEPSGEDFLSPCLAEADLMRRIVPQAEFVQWFYDFLPRVDMEPTRVSDVTDGKLWHLAGLNLSRAWMLEGILLCFPSAILQAEEASRVPVGDLSQAAAAECAKESQSLPFARARQWPLHKGMIRTNMESF
jgi:hypothetical protein